MSASNCKKQHITTDAFLNEPLNLDILNEYSQINERKESYREPRRLVIPDSPEFKTAIKAARRNSRKIFTKKLVIRLTGFLLILAGLLIFLSSCSNPPPAGEIEVYGFDKSKVNFQQNQHFIFNNELEPYKSPIVGIILPFTNDDKVPNDFKSNKPGYKIDKSKTEYDLTAEASITEIRSTEALIDEVENLYSEGRFSEARKIISALILQDELENEKEKEMINLLNRINQKLIHSSDVGGDCKTVTVAKGDTLWKIARENKTTPQIIAQLNDISADKIKVGQKLKVFKSHFNLVLNTKRNFLDLWLGCNLIKRYKAGVRNLNLGMYRMRSKKKGAEPRISFNDNIMLYPDTTSLTVSSSIKISGKDYEELSVLVVSNTILHIK